MFNGFSDKTTDFLWGVRFNNERGWFLEHKSEYIEYVQKPLAALGTGVYDIFTERHPHKNVILHVSRIYRDARRLFGRGPYKDTLWFSIRPGTDNWSEYPMLWFEISPEGYGYGLGIYSPHPALMNSFRKSIDERPGKMAALANAFEQQSEFTLAGDEYKRPKGNPGGALNNWYNRKYITLSNRPADYAHHRPEFLQQLADSFERLMPYYDYFYDLPRDGE